MLNAKTLYTDVVHTVTHHCRGSMYFMYMSKILIFMLQCCSENTTVQKSETQDFLYELPGKCEKLISLYLMPRLSWAMMPGEI